MRRSQHARKETEFLRLKRTRLGLDDFESLKVIGRGAFGEVHDLGGVIIFLMWSICSCYALRCLINRTVMSPPSGPVGAKKRHGAYLCHEDFTESRHAGERTGKISE